MSSICHSRMSNESTKSSIGRGGAESRTRKRRAASRTSNELRQSAFRCSAIDMRSFIQWEKVGLNRVGRNLFQIQIKGRKSKGFSKNLIFWTKSPKFPFPRTVTKFGNFPQKTEK